MAYWVQRNGASGTGSVETRPDLNPTDGSAGATTSQALIEMALEVWTSFSTKTG